MKKFPVTMQRDAMQCGVACLTMICNHYGRGYRLEHAASHCHATNEGVSLQGLKEGAAALGFDTLACRCSAAQLPQAPLPVILHWHQDHFVVLYHISRKGRYYVADPAKGLIKYREDDFMRQWLSTTGDDGTAKGVALLLEPTDTFRRQAPDIKDAPAMTASRVWAFLARYFKPFKRHLLHVALGLVLACVLQLVMPFLTQAIVDRGIRYHDIGLIWLILLGELMIILGRTATDFIRRWLLLHVSMRINIALVSDFFIRLFKLPMAFFDTRLLGDLMQRMGDHGRVQNFLTGQTLSIAFATLSFLVFGVVLALYDMAIFGIFVACSALYGLWSASFLRRRKVLDYRLFEQQARNSNRTYQLLTTMQEVKLQGCQRRRRWEWEDVQADLFEVQMASLKLQQTQEAGSIFINELRNILITVMAATAVIHGSLTLGAMLAIQYIVGQLGSPVSQIMAFVYSLQAVRISLERINEVATRRPESAESAQASTPVVPGDIRLQGVSYRYDPHHPAKALDNVDIDIPEGKVTAIVGASGSGKTTLVKLLLGYYAPSEGRITVAGTPLQAFDPEAWRVACGVVMQDGVVFSDTIRGNIACGDDSPDQEAVRQAARAACLDDYVMTLPLRYDTRVGRDGKGLSQGQRQRLLIARALYRQAPFLFLDEATNSLDAANEQAITRNLADYYAGRTVLVVAHRLSTVRRAHQIIVLDHGRVVEQGNHDTLTARHGRYYELVRNQLELGQ